MAMYKSYGEINIEVTVKRSELLERLKKNREKHKNNFDLAISEWQKELKKAMDSIKPKECYFFPAELNNLWEECPVSHLQEYDQVIDMFTMCVKDEIKLDSKSFNTFCRDEWEWKSGMEENKYYRMIINRDWR